MTQNTPQIEEVTRPWGNFHRFTLNNPSTVKIITVAPNEGFSLQTHEKRAEFWHILDGQGSVEIDGVTSEVSKGDEFFIDIGSTHRASAGDLPLEILEIAFGEFDEDDITRLEDRYGRIA